MKYLGHKICQAGRQPTESKVCAVADTQSQSECMAELRPFLVASEVLQVVPTQPSLDSSTPLQPALEECMLGLGQGSDSIAVFRGAKELLQSFDLLVHLDSEEQLILAYDVLPCGCPMPY